jgi:hypothetical protein
MTASMTSAGDGELHGDRQPLGDGVADRTAAEVDAEVALEQPADVLHVLDEHVVVEVEAVTQLRGHTGRQRPVPGQRPDRVPRQRVDQQEDEEGGADQHRDRQQQSARDVAGHGWTSAFADPGRAGRGREEDGRRTGRGPGSPGPRPGDG